MSEWRYQIGSKTLLAHLYADEGLSACGFGAIRRVTGLLSEAPKRKYEIRRCPACARIAELETTLENLRREYKVQCRREADAHRAKDGAETSDHDRIAALETALDQERARGAVAVKARDKLIEVYEREPPYCGLCMTDEDSEAHSRWTEEDLLPARAAALSDPSPAVQALLKLAEAAGKVKVTMAGKVPIAVDEISTAIESLIVAVDRYDEARGG